MTTPVSLGVLIVEDSENDGLLIVNALTTAGYDVVSERVETAEQMRAALARRAWDVVIADYSLPQFDGRAALALLQETGQDIPFIVVSGTIGEDTAVVMMRAGAHDYLLKGHLERLTPAVARELAQAQARCERRQAQAALGASEQRYRTLFEKMADAVLIFDDERRCVEINPAAVELSGRPPEQLIGRRIEEFMADASAEQTEQEWQRLVAARALQGEWPIRRTDGETRIVEYTAVMDFLPGRHLAIARDITARRNAEAALGQSEERFRLLVEGTHDYAIFMLDAGGQIVSWNSGAQRIYGYTVDEITGQHFSRFYPEADVQQDKPRKALATALREGTYHNEGRRVRKDGSQFVAEVTITTLVDGSGTLKGFSKVTRDITQRTQAEARIETQVERLAALRTIDIAITSGPNLRLTLNTVLAQTVGQLGVDAAGVLLLDPETQLLTYAAGLGFRSEALQHTHLPLGAGHAGRAALERKQVQVADLRSEQTDFLRSPHFAREGFVSYYAVPLIAKDKVNGVLEIFQRAPLKVEAEWLTFLDMLAGQAAIAVDNAQLFDKLQRSNQGLSLAYDATIEGWSRALDLRDKETEGHTQRVAELTIQLARAVGIAETELDAIRRGALLHDIGKMGVPDSILLKPGPLTEEEWAVMRMHPQYAYDLLSPIAYLQPSLDIPYCHHEKWDGSGYPRGLKGEQIPVVARLFAVVDVWDALRSHRPYRPAWPIQKVREHMQGLAGTHFDARILAEFLKWGPPEG